MGHRWCERERMRGFLAALGMTTKNYKGNGSNGNSNSKSQGNGKSQGKSNAGVSPLRPAAFGRDDGFCWGVRGLA